MNNILVTGSNGQLGSELRELSGNYPFLFFFTGSKDLDITNYSKVEEFIEVNKIDVIINCAAYTAVDKAEQNIECSNDLNHLAVANLAEVAKEKSAKLIHVSTDYVFDGESCRPYKETDVTNPQSVYGKTKLDGELAVIKVNPKNSIIIRTSWVYSEFGNNFVKTMLRLMSERRSLNVVNDQIGTPTYALDLAKAIMIIVNSETWNPGVYNYSNEGEISWYDYAVEINKLSRLNCQVKGVSSDQFPTVAKRPNYSLLDKTKIKQTYNVNVPNWKESLEVCISILNR